jgi:hypothetical protein
VPIHLNMLITRLWKSLKKKKARRGNNYAGFSWYHTN